MQEQEHGGATIEQTLYLQQILGTDKRNPAFTVCRDAGGQQLHVYYGAQVLQVVPADKSHAEFKLLVARLYNAGLKVKTLVEEFGVSRKTMKRWGDALKSGDPDRLVQALRGRGGHRKLTLEIQSYVRMRFPSIYAETRYAYSQRMRGEIEQVFQESLSAETLRPLLQELKGPAAEPSEPEPSEPKPSEPEPSEGETAGDSTPEEPPAASGPPDPPVPAPQAEAHGPDNRQESPASPPSPPGAVTLCHHVGVLLFSPVLSQVEHWVQEGGWLLKQWLAAILLGAVNIEQTKLLDFKALTRFLGKTWSSLGPQRIQLGQLATPENLHQLVRLNAERVHLDQCHDFYYDPHGKHYTGMHKVLKGWCAPLRGVGKTLYMDFIHTASGQPVYVEHTDNYEDLRRRFGPTIERFRSAANVPHERVQTFVLDRGIYGRDVFAQIIDAEHDHLITWQKSYRPVAWEAQEITGSFHLQRPRNRSTDLRTYQFEYVDQKWSRDGRMRLLRVQATNPQGRTVQVGVLTDDLNRDAEEIIRLIFSRWLQENDFKYLEGHFGINQIISYGSVAYTRLRNAVEDRQMKNGAYKALEQERQAVRAELKKLLFQEHQHPGKNAKRQERMGELDRQHDHLEQQLAETEKEVSRLDTLIAQDYVRLDTRSKHLMDLLKPIARNAFYDTLEPFKTRYDNYRDDHTLFRNLTQAHGMLIEQGEHVHVLLHPTTNYAPHTERIVTTFLDELNATAPLMPDGSGRRLHFRLGQEAGVQLAIAEA